ncbi:hypothetical protein GTP46_25895 [Duganella sp. FT135W]|uniref:DUF1640 domain-containing protein n=1 Tax=Duganella flavida TaxID=2692175 RepID=A0A6L8KH59_9BURK|nr:hypothetical protein [Duganella flavida]MYM26067.1 hypothetical protein [Duganella flavida]
MPDTNGNEGVEKAGRPAYDVRFAAIEARAAAVETDVAVIHASFATKDDIQLLRSEMRDGHERILALLYEHKLEMKTAMAQQRDDFNAALAKQREDFNAALAKQWEDFHTALTTTHMDFYKFLTNQAWKLYGFASVVIGGVYFIARYVH